MLDARYSHLYFCQSLNRLQCGLSAIAELLVVYSYSHFECNSSNVHVLLIFPWAVISVLWLLNTYRLTARCKCGWNHANSMYNSQRSFNNHVQLSMLKVYELWKQVWQTDKTEEAHAVFCAVKYFAQHCAVKILFKIQECSILLFILSTAVLSSDF